MKKKAKHKRNIDGLIPLNKRSADERESIAKLGGYAKAKAQKEQLTFAQLAKQAINSKPDEAALRYAKKEFPDLDIEDITFKALMVLGLVRRASNGDVSAFEKIQELAPDEIADDENKKIDISDFKVCAKACGYPEPYPQQIEMADFIFSYKEEPRLLLGARSYGKTNYAVIIKGAQEIALNGAKIILVTKEERRSRDLCIEIGRCLECLGVKDFKRSTNEVIQLAGNDSKEPNLIAISLGSRGFRGRHPDFVILDDPITPEASSRADRDQAKRVYDELLKLCHKVRLLGQPVHRNDLYQLTRRTIKTLEMPYGSIPELDTDLEALRLAGVDEASINASYLLKIDDVARMPFADVEISNAQFDIAKGSIACIDPSHEGGDTTAITIAQGYGEFQKLFIAGYCFKLAWYDCKKELVGLLQKYNVKQAYFENNALGEEPIRQFRNFNLSCKIIGFKSVENKKAKIQNAGMFSKSLVLSAQSNTEYKKQFLEYEVGAEHDDAPDSLASLLINVGLMKSAKERGLYK
ncbi:MAG: hypothetical protein LBC07_04295 [Elusimicrobiota bacterium]|nr:hypothetical protein [Elusimicrobiota bacterium]